MRLVLFKLAHRLVTSSPTPSYHNADRFHLHLSILRELSLFDEAYTLLDSDVGKVICSTNLYCNELRREIWKQKGLLKEEGDRAEGLISDKKCVMLYVRVCERSLTLPSDRNWLEFLSVLDATFAYLSLPAAEGENPKDTCKTHIAKTQSFFEKVSQKDGRRDRSGFLGLLELEKRARTHEISSGLGSIVRLICLRLNCFRPCPACNSDEELF